MAWKSFRLQPIKPVANVDDQRHLELSNVFHSPAQDFFYGVEFGVFSLKDKFIVHLKDYPAIEGAQTFFTRIIASLIMSAAEP